MAHPLRLFGMSKTEADMTRCEELTDWQRPADWVETKRNNMNTRILMFAICLGAGLIHGEEQTLFKSGETRNGFFGGPLIKISPANGELGVWVGARGGWILGSALSIGGGMYGLSNGVKADNPDTADLMAGVMGFIVEAVFLSDRLAHGTFSLLVGAGGVGTGGNWNMGMGRGGRSDGGHVFVLEPELNLEINVARFFRFCPGVSYRWLSGDVDVVESAWDLSGPSANFMFKFGRF